MFGLGLLPDLRSSSWPRSCWSGANIECTTATVVANNATRETRISPALTAAKNRNLTSVGKSKKVLDVSQDWNEPLLREKFYAPNEGISRARYMEFSWLECLF